MSAAGQPPNPPQPPHEPFGPQKQCIHKRKNSPKKCQLCFTHLGEEIPLKNGEVMTMELVLFCGRKLARYPCPYHGCTCGRCRAFLRMRGDALLRMQERRQEERGAAQGTSGSPPAVGSLDVASSGSGGSVGHSGAADASGATGACATVSTSGAMRMLSFRDPVENEGTSVLPQDTPVAAVTTPEPMVLVIQDQNVGQASSASASVPTITVASAAEFNAGRHALQWHDCVICGQRQCKTSSDICGACIQKKRTKGLCVKCQLRHVPCFSSMMFCSKCATTHMI